MAESEVAQLRQRIAEEYQAAKWGPSGLAYGTAQHQFITAKMESMGESFAELTEMVGSPQEAAKILANTLEDLPETLTQSTLVPILRRELGNTEETAILIDHIQEMWETIDLLIARFGPEQARKIRDTPSSSLSVVETLENC
jgi:hypothetical protein